MNHAVPEPIVEKLQSLAVKAHGFRARAGALQQIALQHSRQLDGEKATAIAARAKADDTARRYTKHEGLPQMKEAADLAEDAVTKRLRKITEAREGAVAASNLGHRAQVLVTGVMRELGVDARALGIDLADFDVEVGGSIRGDNFDIPGSVPGGKR